MSSSSLGSVYKVHELRHARPRVLDAESTRLTAPKSIKTEMTKTQWVRSWDEATRLEVWAHAFETVVSPMIVDLASQESGFLDYAGIRIFASFADIVEGGDWLLSMWSIAEIANSLSLDVERDARRGLSFGAVTARLGAVTAPASIRATTSTQEWLDSWSPLLRLQYCALGFGLVAKQVLVELSDPRRCFVDGDGKLLVAALFDIIPGWDWIDELRKKRQNRQTRAVTGVST